MLFISVGNGDMWWGMLLRLAVKLSAFELDSSSQSRVLNKIDICSGSAAGSTIAHGTSKSA